MGMFDEFEAAPTPKKRAGLFDEFDDGRHSGPVAVAANQPKTPDQQYEAQGGGLAKSYEKGITDLFTIFAPAAGMQIHARMAELATLGNKDAQEWLKRNPTQKAAADMAIRGTVEHSQSLPQNPLPGKISDAWSENSGIKAPIAALGEALSNPGLALDYGIQMAAGGVPGGVVGGVVGNQVGKQIAKGIINETAKKVVTKGAAGAGVNAGATAAGGYGANLANAYSENGGNLEAAESQAAKQTAAETAVAAAFGAPLAFGSGVAPTIAKVFGLSPVDEMAQTVAGNAATGKQTTGGELAASALLGIPGSVPEVAIATIAGKEAKPAPDTEPDPQAVPPEAKPQTRPAQSAAQAINALDSIIASNPQWQDSADQTVDPILAQSPLPESDATADPILSQTEQQPPRPVAESQAPATSEPGDVGVAPGKAGGTTQGTEIAAAPAPVITDATGMPVTADLTGKVKPDQNLLERDAALARQGRLSTAPGVSREASLTTPATEQPVKLPRKKASPFTTKNPTKYAEAARKHFLSVIKKAGGISVKNARDITNDTPLRSSQMYPGLFTRTGQGIDLVARDLYHAGYLTDEEYNDVDGGVQRARDLIGQALAGEFVGTPAQQERLAALEDVETARLEALHQEEEQAATDEILGLPLTDAEALALHDEANRGIRSDAVQDQIDADRAAQQENEDVRRRFAEGADNTVQTVPGRAEAGDGGSQGRPGRSAVQVPVQPGERGQGNDGRAERIQGTDGGQAFDLTRQSEREIADREAGIARREAEVAKREAEAAAKEKADRERNDFTLTGSDRAADANPGQNDLFSPPTQPKNVSAKAEKGDTLPPGYSVEKLASPLPNGGEWVLIKNKGAANEQQTYYATESEARAAASGAAETPTGTTGGRDQGASEHRAQFVQSANRDDNGRLGLKAQAVVDRIGQAVRSTREVLAKQRNGELAQRPERKGYCFLLSARASMSNVGDMVIGIDTSTDGSKIWHAVVQRDGYTYDPTFSQWFAPGVYEALGFVAVRSLSPSQVREYVKDNNGLVPDAKNQGLGENPSDIKLWEGRAQPSVDASSSTPFADPSQTETGEKGAIPSGSNPNIAPNRPDSNPVKSVSENAVPESDWLSEGAIAQIVEERLAQFRHQPPVLILDSEADIGVTAPADQADAVAAGMVSGGKIHLFRNGLGGTADVNRTLWHELLHYGLRRFLTKEQYIAAMQRLYEGDAWIKSRANAWLAKGGEDVKQARKMGEDYARARGVDEALAELAEDNGEYQNNSLKAKTIRTVSRWIAMLADKFGFKAEAARWRAITNDEARDMVRVIFGKLQNDEAATSGDWAFTADGAYARRVPAGPSSPQQPIRYQHKPEFNIDPETRAEAIQRKHQDKMNRWAKVQRQIKEQGGTVGLDRDVYHAMERMTGRAAERIDVFTHDTIKPLLKRTIDLKTNLEELGTYLMALGAKDRNAYIQTVRQDMPDNGSGMSNQEAAQIIADYQKRPDFAKFDALARDFQKLTDRKLKVLVGGGVITQQQANDLKQAFGFYVPYKGFEKIDEEGNRAGGTGAGYSTPKRFSKQAFGRVSKAGQVVENIIRDYEQAVILAEKSNVGRYARNLAQANPDPTLWTIDQTPSQPVMKGGVVGLMQKAFDNEHEIRFIENGKEVRIQLHDPLLAQTYNNLGQEPMAFIMEAGDKVNRILRQTYTQKNPAFVLVNAVRDIQTGLAVMTGEMGAVNAIKALRHAAGAWKAAGLEAHRRGRVTGEWAKYLDAYRKTGAQVAYYAIEDIEAKQAKLQELLAREGGQSFVNQWRQHGGGLQGAKATAKLAAWRTYNNAVVDVIESLNSGFENMMRLAAFRQYIDDHGGLNGASKETLAEASRIAKNLTVNFNRKGEKTRGMNALYLFWNANVQGTQNLYRAAMQSQHKGQVRAVYGGMVGLGFLMSLATGDEDDDLTPDYLKDTSIVIHIGGGKRIQIPLAYGLGYFVALGYEIGNLVQGRQTPIKTALHLVGAALQHFSPLGNPIHDGKADVKDLAVTVTPTIMKPVVMSATNRNAFGYDIVPKFDEDAPDRTAMRPATQGGTYDKAAGYLDKAGMDVSPETLKMVTTFVTGGLGTFIGDGTSAGMVAAKGEFDPEKTPILKRFYGVNDVEEWRSRFYRQVEDVKTQAREQGKKQKELLGEDDESTDSTNDFTKRMKALRAAEMAAYGKDRYRQAEGYQQQQIDLARAFKREHDGMIKRHQIERR